MTENVVVQKRLKNEREVGRQQGMIQGAAMAIAIAIREYDITTALEGTWRAIGLSIEECEKNGVDEFDMEVLRQHFK